MVFANSDTPTGIGLFISLSFRVMNILYIAKWDFAIKKRNKEKSFSAYAYGFFEAAQIAAASAMVQQFFSEISMMLPSSPEKKAPKSINGTVTKACMENCK